MKNNKSYIGITFIILVFGIFVVPKIIDRISNDTITEGNRLNKVKIGVLTTNTDSGLVKFSKVPEFNFRNQDSLELGNSFFKGKV